MVKVRYNDRLTGKIREKEIQNVRVILSENNGLVKVRYDSSDGSVSFISSFKYCIVTLIINSMEYTGDMIKEHFAEVQVLLDQERMERLLKEIDDDQGSFESV